MKLIMENWKKFLNEVEKTDKKFWTLYITSWSYRAALVALHSKESSEPGTWGPIVGEVDLKDKRDLATIVQEGFRKQTGYKGTLKEFELANEHKTAAGTYYNYIGMTYEKFNINSEKGYGEEYDSLKWLPGLESIGDKQLRNALPRLGLFYNPEYASRINHMAMGENNPKATKSNLHSSIAAIFKDSISHETVMQHANGRGLDGWGIKEFECRDREEDYEKDNGEKYDPKAVEAAREEDRVMFLSWIALMAYRNAGSGTLWRKPEKVWEFQNLTSKRGDYGQINKTLKEIYGSKKYNRMWANIWFQKDNAKRGCAKHKPLFAEEERKINYGGLAAIIEHILKNYAKPNRSVLYSGSAVPLGDEIAKIKRFYFQKVQKEISSDKTADELMDIYSKYIQEYARSIKNNRKILDLTKKSIKGWRKIHSFSRSEAVARQFSQSGTTKQTFNELRIVLKIEKGMANSLNVSEGGEQEELVSLEDFDIVKVQPFSETYQNVQYPQIRADIASTFKSTGEYGIPKGKINNFFDETNTEHQILVLTIKPK